MSSTIDLSRTRTESAIRATPATSFVPALAPPFNSVIISDDLISPVRICKVVDTRELRSRGCALSGVRCMARSLAPSRHLLASARYEGREQALTKYFRIHSRLYIRPDTYCRTSMYHIQCICWSHSPISSFIHLPLHPSRKLQLPDRTLSKGYTKKGYLQTPAPPSKNATSRILQRRKRRECLRHQISRPPVENV